MSITCLFIIKTFLHTCNTIFETVHWWFDKECLNWRRWSFVFRNEQHTQQHTHTLTHSQRCEVSGRYKLSLLQLITAWWGWMHACVCVSETYPVSFCWWCVCGFKGANDCLCVCEREKEFLFFFKKCLPFLLFYYSYVVLMTAEFVHNVHIYSKSNESM